MRTLFPISTFLLLLHVLITTTATPTSTTTMITNATYPRIPTQDYKLGRRKSSAYKFMAPQNAARAALGLPPLIWDRKLARYARWWANQRRWDCALEHSNGPFGENVFWGSSTSFTPYDAARDWVEEKKYYNYGYNSCSFGEECGHYTQIVWRKSRRIGCAKAKCFLGRGVYMVCDYDPPGNYIGEKPY
ncbi:hypothetical protein Leryth_018611 [Lithospermum erythrorhizon]|nr:hypothetical protein Leryth_018611 [Lithospermum erythrorhizon]